MAVLIVIIAVVVVCFAGVLLVGAPYLPTLRPQIELALDLTELESGGTLLELGSGDGRVALAAARRGYRVIGYELNPLLVVVSKIATRRYRALVKIYWGDFLRASWPAVDAIFIFGINRLMPKVDAKITAANIPVRLISFTFKVPGKKPSKARRGLFVYDYK